MPMDDVELIHTHEWPAEQVIELYRVGGWWKDGYDPEGIPPLMKGSFDLVIAHDKADKKAIGMGRIISDGVSDGYLQDLVVIPEFRGRGIGRAIVLELLRSARRSGLVWIGLIAEEGSYEFYRELGFKVFNGTPMIFDTEREV
ncbi:MAG: GNAT family N-acetyltransferase [Candidatus Thermoplasmatota archaeon]|nr:GNAT family N-acetyltransferase [Candidatus Thermoplasmatota archaeon]